MKTPVPWNGQCFVHSHSDDLYDHYQYDSATCAGYLKQRRANGMWLASLREAKGVSEPRAHQAFESETDVARRALDEALASLRARVAGDQKWLAVIDEEIGG